MFTSDLHWWPIFRLISWHLSFWGCKRRDNIYNDKIHRRGIESSRYNILTIVTQQFSPLSHNAHARIDAHTHTHTNQYYAGKRCILSADLKEEDDLT